MGQVKEFKARSGRVVTQGEDGSIAIGLRRGYLSREAVFDAEEFFQAKRDDDLGRWRWPVNPHYVVYADRDTVVVLDERNGRSESYSRTLCESAPRIVFLGAHAAAHAFYEAHPVVKPWHDAQPGEFWNVCHGDTVEMCRVDDMNGLARFTGVGDEDMHVSMPVTHPSITQAVRFVVEGEA